MDLRIGNRTTTGVSLVKLDQDGRRPANPADGGATKLDALRVQDQKGDYFLVSKQGLINKDDMWAGRGDTVEVGGQKFTQSDNVNRADTTSEQIHKYALKAVDTVGCGALSALGLGRRAFEFVTGG